MFFSTLALMFAAMTFNNFSGNGVTPSLSSSTANTETYVYSSTVSEVYLDEFGTNEFKLINSKITGTTHNVETDVDEYRTYSNFFYVSLKKTEHNHYNVYDLVIQASSYAQFVAPSFSYRLNCTFNGENNTSYTLNLSSRTISSYLYSGEGLYRNELYTTTMFGDIDTYLISIDYTIYFDFVYTVSYDTLETSLVNYDSGYQDGYNNGYDVGYDDGNTNGYNDGHSSGYDEGYGTGYSEGYDTGKTVGYGEGYNTALGTHDFTFTNLFASISDTPILMIRRLFGFELFGVSLIAVFMSLFTALIVIKVIKKVF